MRTFKYCGLTFMALSVVIIGYQVGSDFSAWLVAHVAELFMTNVIFLVGVMMVVVSICAGSLGLATKLLFEDGSSSDEVRLDDAAIASISYALLSAVLGIGSILVMRYHPLTENWLGFVPKVITGLAFSSSILSICIVLHGIICAMNYNVGRTNDALEA